MITVERLYQRESGETFPSGNLKRASVEWKSPGVDVKSAIANLIADPGFTLTHPDDPSLSRFVGIRPVQPLGAGNDVGWVLAAEYSHPSVPDFSGFPPPPIEEASYNQWSSKTDTAEIVYPFIQMVRTNTPAPGGGLATSETWARDDRRLTVARQRVTRTLNLTSFGTAELDAVIGEAGKMHLVTGANMRFVGSDHTHLSDGVHHVTYEWEWIGGNGDLTSLYTGAGYQVWVAGVTTEGFIQIEARPDNYVYVVGDQSGTPTIKAIMPYATGNVTNLPGWS